MRIEQIEAIPIEVPVLRPLKMAVATVHVRTCIVVRIRTADGLTGIGESVVTRYFTGESLASAHDLITNAYTEAIIGMSADDVEEIATLMRKISVYNPGARAAVEMALHDIVAQASGLPLYEYYGGKQRDSVPTVWHTSGDSPEAMAEEAAGAVAEGFPYVKLKVGGDVDKNLTSTYAVREAIGDDVMLLPDANQGWNVEDALRYLEGAADARPGFVEQPIHRDDIVGMAELVRRSPVLVAGDEALFNVEDLRNYIAFNAVGAVVTKLMKSAGPIGMRKIIELADEADLGVHFAGMAGQTSISAAHAAHQAMATPNLRFGAGISPHYLADDICTERFMPIKGHLHPSNAPGVGLTIDEDKLAHFRIDT